MMGFGKFFGLGNKDIQEKDVQAAEKELLPKAEVKYEPAELPIEQIQVNPFQPRRIFQKEALQELAASVQEFGILQPLLVRRKGDTAELIAGERRLRAAKMAARPGPFMHFYAWGGRHCGFAEGLRRCGRRL